MVRFVTASSSLSFVLSSCVCIFVLSCLFVCSASSTLLFVCCLICLFVLLFSRACYRVILIIVITLLFLPLVRLLVFVRFVCTWCLFLCFVCTCSTSRPWRRCCLFVCQYLFVIVLFDVNSVVCCFRTRPVVRLLWMSTKRECWIYCVCWVNLILFVFLSRIFVILFFYFLFRLFLSSGFFLNLSFSFLLFWFFVLCSTLFPC